MKRLLERHGWDMALAALLALLLLATRLIQPNFGASGIEALARAALPFAFAAAGMAVVVIAGGIDLSIASMMAVAGVTAARLMQGASAGEAGLVLVLVLLIGVAMGTINGLLIVLTRLPDIVVTLGMLFVWEGTALLILNAPGGAAAPWLRALVTGPALPALTPMIPKALVLLVVCLAAIWIPLRRSRLGLSLYAIGSDATAAFRSGVAIGRTRIAAYALAGLFAALGGLSLTASVGIGEPIPGPYLLASVAAVVLGGVALTGGRGGLLGPILAVFILRVIRLDLTLLAIDPNVTAILEGTIMAVVVMLGGLLLMRRRQA
ncbi:monosaccharide ABC transporter membrane protein, CUT2 family [Rubellimicrobium thermophilum DSM 16684]|uniref:Autoinducer 2 import system permease protein LsrD n=1 Tax=Rubellimicrobium thermophilum DSM 16684 TaxID=1123069 RepID=S9QYW3_9RHOB|nr:ABC transporter permease [Rubellimicrobium thermophilum]EPX84848.1 monosaccharide ABC transporter membrane protein, CUT2 family [Rubellimicrobium thermophilum DSM 16684]